MLHPVPMIPEEQNFSTCGVGPIALALQSFRALWNSEVARYEISPEELFTTSLLDSYSGQHPAAGQTEEAFRGRADAVLSHCDRLCDRSAGCDA